jgi:hypothetical protein
MSSRHIEITVYGDDLDDDQAYVRNVTVSEDGVLADHVPMALVRAITATCVQLGLDSPAQLFRAADDGVARLREVRHEDILREVESVLVTRGYGRFTTAQSLGALLDELGGKALLTASLGPRFVESLVAARTAYRTGALAGRDLDAHDTAGIEKAPEPGQVATLLRAVQALGVLLNQMTAIEPELKGEDLEVTGGRGEPC